MAILKFLNDELLNDLILKHSNIQNLIEIQNWKFKIIRFCVVILIFACHENASSSLLLLLAMTEAPLFLILNSASMIAELLSDSVTRFISSVGYFGIFFLMALESAAIPIPSELIMTFSGYLAYQGVFDFAAIVIIGAAGCMAGSIVSYWVGLKGGRPFIGKYGKYFFLNHHHLNLAEDWFKKYGDKAVFFSRMLPVVRTFISLPAGMGKYSFKKLVIFSFAGSLPWCFALAYVGFKLGPHWKKIIAFFNGLDIIIVAAIIISAAYFWKIKQK